jgi:hypothetical protein
MIASEKWGTGGGRTQTAASPDGDAMDAATAGQATGTSTRSAALDHPRSTAALISFRSSRSAFFIMPLNRNSMGTDRNLVTIPWGRES